MKNKKIKFRMPYRSRWDMPHKNPKIYNRKKEQKRIDLLEENYYFEFEKEILNNNLEEQKGDF